MKTVLAIFGLVIFKPFWLEREQVIIKWGKYSSGPFTKNVPTLALICIIRQDQYFESFNNQPNKVEE